MRKGYMQEQEQRASAPTEAQAVSRRQFLGALAAASAVAAFEQLAANPQAVLAHYEEQIVQGTLSQSSADLKALDVLERMRIELLRALQKQPSERRWVMVIDLRKCIGCHACTIGCVAENKLPPGVVYRPVLEEEYGTYPNVARRFIPRPCMQCENPPCVPVCPVNATFTNAEGIVEMDYERCIGCRYCLTACPYSARVSDFGFTYTEEIPVIQGLLGTQAADDYERAPNFEYGKLYAREGRNSPVGNARKCHFCQHRILEGVLPACVTTCIGRATFFGDANDPESLVAELIARPNVLRLREELGTEPRVYYLK
ncbi:MAG: (4Fe-4S)-binding protein [Candidatus Thermofonsia Clade 1 bacterium]|uniref:(4Fe-4S)-binding protein n=1 Tax=Candidatus Thermofonsia Clade 1 bacterium TaxID=2364210 RepID=A0A2M8PZB9_9CHLR|nr:MAG: (4Fe-4S)-binding protein [Candidatus Thermofonsia Clade 1 bacterium]PJF42899.1 MAG: (4Fe-4S)-binding protein [Candidatus Thermofonsia Clade 1 bacterium]RMF52645.1 MAG: 4Fe-4S dicluster domain-containing protein [Chloroflexota bacterium]